MDIQISYQCMNIKAHLNNFWVNVHTKRNQLNLILKTTFINTEVSFQSTWAFHGVMGFIAFGLAMPCAVVSVWLRIFLSTKRISLHVYGNLISFCCTVKAFIIAVSTMNKEDHFTETRHVVELILLLLTSVQVWFGLFRPSRERGKDNDKWFIMHRFFWDRHPGIRNIQIRYGLSMFSREFATKDRSFAFSLFVTMLTIVVGGLKIWSIHRSREESGFGRNKLWRINPYCSSS